MSTRTRQFVNHVKSHLSEYGMRLIAGRGLTVNLNTGGRADGYFCDREKVIRFGNKNKNWLSTLVHEYGHFLQWIDSSTYSHEKDHTACYIVDEYLFNNTPSELLAWAFHRVRTYERDCEIRSLKLIREWRLPIKEKTYIRNANMYVYSYYVMETYGEWNPFSISPYTKRSVMKLIPSNFRAKSNSIFPIRIKRKLLSCR